MTKKNHLSSGDLTPGERLLISRRRQDLTQAQMADALGMSLLAYRSMELGEERIPGGYKIPKVALGVLAPFEQAVILRHRSGKSQADTCADMGISKWWLRRMEINDDCNTDRLLSYWNLI